jgi:hypothetical protein
MRDRRARVAVVSLILLFPALMVGMNPRTTSVREAVLPVLATQAILVVGLSNVARERQRLLAARSAPTPDSKRGLVSNLPHASRPLRKAPAGRS